MMIKRYFGISFLYSGDCHKDVGGNHFLTTPKTATSIRDLYINDTLLALLKKHKVEQRKLQLSLGEKFLHPEMVFTSATGNYKDRSSLNTSLKRFLKGTDFEYLTLHKLRHTNATLLLNNGIDLKTVSEHLDHADIQITAGTYTAVLEIVHARKPPTLWSRF